MNFNNTVSDNVNQIAGKFELIPKQETGNNLIKALKWPYFLIFLYCHFVNENVICFRRIRPTASDTKR